MKTTNKKSNKVTANSITKSIQEKVTSAIIKCLEVGIVPWQREYQSELGLAKSFDGKVYRGINQWICYASMITNKFKTNTWITYRKCASEGGQVLKGSKGTTIVFWNFIYKCDKDCTLCDGKSSKTRKCDCQRKIGFLKSFTVFNLCQTSLYDPKAVVKEPKVEVEVNTEMAESLIGNWNDLQCPIRYGYDNSASPFYSPSSDFINVPFGDGVEWVNEECLHKTTFHEIMHSTGHKSRNSREGVTGMNFFGSHEYSKEELVAEMGSQILADICGFKQSHIENTSAYIGSWLKALKNNHDWLIWASTRAEQGVDLILNNSMKEGK